MAVSDIVFVQDLTGSYIDDLPNLKVLLPAVVNRLSNPLLATVFGADLRFGVASFKDKPISPLGSPGDYVYRAELGLTNNITAVKNTINNFTADGGNDLPESQLDALLYAALDSGGSLGYRVGSSRVVFLATDATYHVAGDRRTASPGDTIPNNGDAVINPLEDYATIPRVRTALESNNIIPIFLATSDVVASYQGLVTQIGRGGVLTLGSKSENVADAIKEAVARSQNVISTDVVSTDGDDFFSGGDFSPGDKVVFGGGGNDSISLAGVVGNHFIDGGAGSDILFGGAGADKIDGGSDEDELTGGNGNDILFGSSGIDFLSGGNGNDYLQGESGDDLLRGGAGSDTFAFATGSKFDIKELGVDTINDFAPGQDKIQLSKFTFTTLSNSVFPTALNAADFAVVRDDDLAAGSSAKIIYNSVNGSLFYNPNGSAAGFDAVADFGGRFVQLTGSSTPALTAVLLNSKIMG